MKKRVHQITKNQDAFSIWMGTFHSIFAKILRKEAHIIGYTQFFTIYDNDDSIKIIRRIIKDLNLNKEIYSITGEKGADITVDTTGNAKVIEQAYELTAPNGKTILAGVPKNKITIYSLPLHFKKILTGSHGGDSIPDIEIPRYIRLINKKKMTLDNMITDEFKFSEINDAIDLLRSGKAGRIVIKMN